MKEGNELSYAGTIGRVAVVVPEEVATLFAIANVSWKLLTLTSSKEMFEGSVGSGVQVIVIGAPEVALDTDKFDKAEARGRRKRMLNRKSEKENGMCKGRR